MKQAKSILNVKSILFLAAAITALFVIFPEFVRQFDGEGTNPAPINQPHMPPPSNIPQGEPFPDGKMERPPMDFSEGPDVFKPGRFASKNIFDFAYFFALTLLLLYINTNAGKIRFFSKEKSNSQIIILIVITLAICTLAQYTYTLAEQLVKQDRFGPEFGFFNGMVMFRCLFSGISAFLFSQLLLMVIKQQKTNLEVERLKSESIQNRFDALTAQINPHFFFNSLNALAGLVRIKDNSNALQYINELSRIFRYVLKGNWQELVPLSDEMKFLDAYRYLLEIRYGDHLKFEIDLNTKHFLQHRLPYLSLQPIIENVTKHNVISSRQPMTVNITIKNDDTLVVSNIMQAKIDTEPGTGIGLSNLDNRYKLLTSKSISTYITKNLFVVELPLTPLKHTQNESTNN